MKTPALSHACNNLIRVCRQTIRQVHSLRATNELNAVLDTYRLGYQKAIMEGRDPDVEVERILQPIFRRVIQELNVEQIKAKDREATLKALSATTQRKALRG